LAAHGEEFLDGLPEMSNCYCHPGKAGGSPFRNRFQNRLNQLITSSLLSQTEHARHGGSQLGPLLRFHRQLLASGSGEGVVAGMPIAF
jgi:hypothetical protein